MIRKIFNNKRYVTSLTILSLFAVGLVFAAWTTNGGGSAYAEAGSSSAAHHRSNVSAFTTGRSSTRAPRAPSRSRSSTRTPTPCTVTAVSGQRRHHRGRLAPLPAAPAPVA